MTLPPTGGRSGRGYQGSKPYLLDVQKHMVDFDFQPGTDLAERDRERETENLGPRFTH